jgi:Uma2 family endonuclease
MTAQPNPKRKYTVEEYIELLHNSDERFEYFDGEVVSMAGGKLAHGRIAKNLGRQIGNLLEDSPCQVFGSDVAIKTVRAQPFRYPDLSGVCGEPLIEEFRGIDMLLNPVFICEVLSPRTELYDREEKFLVYQAIDSFQEYLLVAQQRPHVTRYLRQPNGQWLRDDIIGLESSVRLESLSVTLSLRDIYRRVNPPPPKRICQQRNSLQFERASVI